MTSRSTLIGALLVATASCPGISGLVVAPAQAVTLTISCGSVAMEYQLCREGVQDWARKTGHSVSVIPAPNSSTERLTLYEHILSSGSRDIDIFQIDVYWPGLLADHLLDLTPHAGDVVSQHFPASIANNTVKGRLVAIPWFSDAGILYYRADLLEKHGFPVPRTWQQLTETARAIQQAEREEGLAHLWGFVFQASPYEGLTCVALEWIASFGGGTFIEPDGTVSIDNPAARDALALAASWIDTITPRGVLNYSEEESRRIFQSGNAVFMRNWPYAWALVNGEDSAVRGRVGATQLPLGAENGSNGGTLGGWQLAIARNTKYPRAAASLVMHLTSREEQKRRAIRASFNPTIPDLNKDRQVRAAAPFLGSMRDTFTAAIPRPSDVTGKRYPKVSQAIFTRVREALSGRASPREAIDALARDLREIRGAGW